MAEGIITSKLINDIKKRAKEFEGGRNKYANEMNMAIYRALEVLDTLPPEFEFSYATKLKKAAYTGTVQDVKNVEESIENEIKGINVKGLKKYKPDLSSSI